MKYFSLFSSLILYREIVSNTSENISLLISEGSGTANKKTLDKMLFTLQNTNKNTKEITRNSF